jgi:hypothetical protein
MATATADSVPVRPIKARRDATEPVAAEDVKNVMVLSFAVNEGLVNQGLLTRNEKCRPRFEYAAHPPTGFKFPYLFSGVLQG